MIRFNRKKNIKDSIRDGLIVTLSTRGVFYHLKRQ